MINIWAPGFPQKARKSLLTIKIFQAAAALKNVILRLEKTKKVNNDNAQSYLNIVKI